MGKLGMLLAVVLFFLTLAWVSAMEWADYAVIIGMIITFLDGLAFTICLGIETKGAIE